MVSEAEFAAEERRLGKKVHEHDGVWWVEAAPMYCKPVHEFRMLEPGRARPAMLRSAAGYSHQVPAAEFANRFVSWMVIDGKALKEFGLTAISSKRRNKVRNGKRNLTIRILSTSEEYLEDLRSINISQAERFSERGDRNDYLPAEYYIENEATWRENFKKLMGHRAHRFWGAFREERLVAYIDVIEVVDTWIIGAVKSHTESLGFRPVDLLYFSVLEAARDEPACARAVNGGPDPDRPTLDRFKEQFGFTAVEIPYFTRTRLPLTVAKKYGARWVKWWHKRTHR